MPDDDSLQNYRRARDLRSSPEPSGGPTRSEPGSPLFVIQKHDASTLHYDVRLEADGVLKSWSVPKGPSTDPREKRLAVPTEDHPLDYADFEGIIPEGEYGAGAVIVWDRGTYRNLTEEDGESIPVADAIERGHVSVRLDGEKLTGGFAFTRTGRGRDTRWLLVKQRDEAADARRNPVSTQQESVATGRGLADVEADAAGEACTDS